MVVSIIIAVAFVVAIAIFAVQYGRTDIKSALLAAVALLVGSVPIALPLVIIVTMASYNALITSMPALQEVASMTCLCSDKTGTLTTAKMDVMNEKIYSRAGYTPEEVFEMTVACCNRNNMGDAIDGGIMRKWDSTMAGGDSTKGFQLIKDNWMEGKSNGFHNAAKRTVHWMSRKGGKRGQGEIVIAKGLI